MDAADWSEPPLPTSTADSVVMLSPPETQDNSQAVPHEAHTPPPTTTPEVIVILSSPESKADPHEPQSPPPTTTPEVIIILSSPESQCGSPDAFHTAPSPVDDIDVSQCMVNRAVIDVDDDESDDSSDEARELMAPLFAGLGFNEPHMEDSDKTFVPESSRAAVCRRRLDGELKVSEREREVKRMKFSAEASGVVENRFVLVEPSDVVENRFVLVEPTGHVNSQASREREVKRMKFSDNNEGVKANFVANLQPRQNEGGQTDHVNSQASRSNMQGRRVLPSSFLEKPRKERRYPSAFDVLKALAENDKDGLCGMDLVEAARRLFSKCKGSG